MRRWAACRVTVGSGVLMGGISVAAPVAVAVTVEVAAAVTVGQGVFVGVGSILPPVAVGVGTASPAYGAPGLPKSPAESGQGDVAVVQVAGESMVVRSRLAPGVIVRPSAAPQASSSTSAPSGASRISSSALLARVKPL